MIYLKNIPTIVFNDIYLKDAIRIEFPTCEYYFYEYIVIGDIDTLKNNTFISEFEMLKIAEQVFENAYYVVRIKPNKKFL